MGLKRGGREGNPSGTPLEKTKGLARKQVVTTKQQTRQILKRESTKSLLSNKDAQKIHSTGTSFRFVGRRPVNTKGSWMGLGKRSNPT